jgi:phage terminase Nu1 subunit (DNA packaging protein)
MPATSRTRKKPAPKLGGLPAAIKQKDLAKLVGLTVRRVQILTNEGVLVRTARSEYDPVVNVARYLDFKIKAEVERLAPPSSDRLRDRREQQLAMKMAREDRQVIALEEALVVFDEITGQFVLTMNGLPAQITRDVGERKRIEKITDAARSQLAERFAESRQALRTGKQHPPSDAEDDA